MALKLPKLPKIKTPKLPKIKAPKLPKIKTPKLPTKAGVAAGLTSGMKGINLKNILPLIFAIPLAIVFFFVMKIGFFGAGTTGAVVVSFATLLSGYGIYSNLPTTLNVADPMINGIIFIASASLAGYAIYLMNQELNKPKEETKA